MTKLTTQNGAPTHDDQNSVTAGEQGPILLEDWPLIEKLAHFNRERIPERVVHAKGTGAYGQFKLTKSLAEFTVADYLQREGEETEVFLRFSTVGGESGSADAARDPRGFALKFYTKEGNHDIVGNNTPVFFLRDPIKFPDFIHTQKRNPTTNLKDAQAMWDFWALNPQAMHQITILMSDRGIPRSYRHMNGYGSHTFGLWNAKGERFWVKWHFKTQQGIDCLSNEESADLCATDPDHAQRDLVESIENGDHPSWTVYVQIMPENSEQDINFNPFDLTKVWPHNDCPLQEIGVLTLNKNVRNYFAEVEQAAFSPSNFVSGIGPSPDKMLQARLFSYPDAQRYRLGVNYNELPVNCPHATRAQHYQRGGTMAGTHDAYQQCTAASGQGGVNYGPNSVNGPAEDKTTTPPPYSIDGIARRHDHQVGNCDYTQAGNLFRLFTPEEQTRLAETIAGSLSQTETDTQEKMLAHFSACDPHYGELVEAQLNS